VEDAGVVDRAGALALDQSAILTEVELDAAKDLEVFDLEFDTLIVEVEGAIGIAGTRKHCQALVPDQIFTVTRDGIAVDIGTLVAIEVDIAEHRIAA
jgi:hypothetical protein